MQRDFQHCIHRAMLAGTLLSLISTPVLAVDVPDITFPAVSNNAALQYWHAFAVLPPLDAEQEKLLDNRATVPLDDAVLKLLDQSQTSLMFLGRGAKFRRCDWGLDYRDGGNMYLPHLAKARTLARLAALDARRAFEAGDYDRGSGDIFGMAALARQVGSDQTLVSMLVCFGIEGMAIDTVAPYLPELGGSYEDAMAAFESLPPSPSLTQAVLCEKQLAAAVLQQIRDAEERHPGSWRDTWKTIVFGAENPPIPFENIESFDELVEMMDKFYSIYNELIVLAALPPREFDAKFPAFVERAGAASAMAGHLLPAMQKFVAVQRRSQARSAMILAGVAVIEGGPEKLAEIRDPFGDGPFEYRKLDSGFELSSKLLDDGKPVTLVIGEKSATSIP
jgi:hypothetical protein